MEAIEKEIRKTPYHKGTERHIGLLRAKIARLRDEEIERNAKKSGGGGGYAVKKQGDATIVLVGPPSVGKSTLLNALTNAQSKVAPYEFTTVSVIPGMMKYKNAYIQILDVPGLIQGAEEGKGRGREVLSVVRGADLLVIMTDQKYIKSFSSIQKALERNGIRINQRPGDISIEKKLSGGITVHSNLKNDVDNLTIKDIANQFGIKNAEIAIRENLSIQQLIDSFSKNIVYTKALFVINKADEIKNKHKYHDFVLISARDNNGLEGLKDQIWKMLDFSIVYLVKPDEQPNYDNPIVVKTKYKLKDVAEKIGNDFSLSKTMAKIWGPGSKYPGQEVPLNKSIQDGMQIRFI
ncbi:hypothetical protein A2V80_02695 [Candidatus Woesebacteria bacterium RBG_16_39_8b]|uniref:OBG-type G domain-containing protein n=1 Tax=Candidatus Woesebacteria bacterium RBG_16_39_8b TaxID=1802482 RepID=A0A1F7X9G8_9BACT|nr:MAG: hypothetical protein A2V80_02695 [Candidatus Woesebacteria bacterium RBG_16_39_8b]